MIKFGGELRGGSGENLHSSKKKENGERVRPKFKVAPGEKEQKKERVRDRVLES